MKLNTRAKEIQQVNPGGSDKQPKHQAPTISSIDKSLKIVSEYDQEIPQITLTKTDLQPVLY